METHPEMIAGYLYSGTTLVYYDGVWREEYVVAAKLRLM